MPPGPDSRTRLSLLAGSPRPTGGKRNRPRRSGSALAVDHATRDVVHLDPVVHGLLLEEPPRFLFGLPVLVHEDALGAVDRLACLESLGEVAAIPLGRRELRIPTPRHPPCRDNIPLLKL